MMRKRLSGMALMAVIGVFSRSAWAVEEKELPYLVEEVETKDAEILDSYKVEFTPHFLDDFADQYPEDLVERMKAIKQWRRRLAIQDWRVKDVKYGTPEVSLDVYLERENLTLDAFDQKLQDLDWTKAWMSREEAVSATAVTPLEKSLSTRYYHLIFFYDTTGWYLKDIPRRPKPLPTPTPVDESKNIPPIPEYIEDPQIFEAQGGGDPYYNTFPEKDVWYVEDEKYGNCLPIEDFVALEGVDEDEVHKSGQYRPHAFTIVHPPKDSGNEPFLLISVYRSRILTTPLYPVEGYRYTRITLHDY